MVYEGSLLFSDIYTELMSVRLIFCIISLPAMLGAYNQVWDNAVSYYDSNFMNELSLMEWDDEAARKAIPA